MPYRTTCPCFAQLDEGCYNRETDAKTSAAGRGTQVVRERSAKPLCVGSIPTRASTSCFILLIFLGCLDGCALAANGQEASDSDMPIFPSLSLMIEGTCGFSELA